jgi:hypothetical protein
VVGAGASASASASFPLNTRRFDLSPPVANVFDLSHRILYIFFIYRESAFENSRRPEESTLKRNCGNFKELSIGVTRPR